MPTLLFVNNSAKTSINAHKQRGRRHVRRDRLPIILDERRQKVMEYRVREVVIPATIEGEEFEELVREVSATWTTSPSPRPHKREEEDLDQRDYLQRSNKIQKWYHQEQQPKLPVRVSCGEGMAADPFNSSCTKIDGEMHNLLQFYDRIVHPNTWHMESREQWQTSRITRGARGIGRGCFEDEMSMYCLLARTASEVQSYDKFKTRRSVEFYMNRAIAATRRKITAHQQAPRNDAGVDTRMIMDIFYLGGAEFYRFELDAALVHVQAVKQMVDSVGGMGHVDQQLRELIILGDTYLAAERMKVPLLDAADIDPGPDPDIAKWASSHGKSSRGLRMELLSEDHRNIVPADLRRLIEDLNEYINVLSLSQQHSNFPTDTPHWIHLRDLATRNRLLALRTADARTEAIRVALIMWELMVMTVTCRKRTIKLMAPKLKRILLTIDPQDWIGHESVLCWILSIGSMSAMPGSDTEAWFTKIVKLPRNTWHDSFFCDEYPLRDLACRFSCLESMQQLIVGNLPYRIAAAC